MAATDDELAGAAIGARVEAFYEGHPYPPPVKDLKGYRRKWDERRRRADAHLFWPHEPYREDRSILIAGCGTSQAAKHAVRWPAAQVTGIDFSAKLLLEVAVVMLGAGLSAVTVMSAGWALLVAILGIVAGALVLSFAIGRLFGLSKRLALLVACGNSICGNSAIAAVASVIGADGDEVASSIAFTAVLGVVVVLILPLVGAMLGMTQLAYGALAGLTVYAVPQVLAATAPVGPAAVQIGTLVKLIRVLMLGPVCLGLSLVTTQLRDEADEPAPHVTAGDRPRPGRPPLHQLVPWFVIGFLVMAALRSAGLIPLQALPLLGEVAAILMVVSMAALGLGVDVRTVSRAGGRVTATVILSLLALGVVSFALVRLLGL